MFIIRIDNYGIVSRLVARVVGGLAVHIGSSSGNEGENNNSDLC